MHLARQLVLSLEFSTQHHRLEKMERKINELHDEKESLQSDYEASQHTVNLLRNMVERSRREFALQVQETVKTEILMGHAVTALDDELVESRGKAIQLEAKITSLHQQNAQLAKDLETTRKEAADRGSKLGGFK